MTGNYPCIIQGIPYPTSEEFLSEEYEEYVLEYSRDYHAVWHLAGTEKVPERT